MRRRDFIQWIAGAAAFWPLTLHAQQRGRLRRVGVLWHAGNEEQEGENLTSLVQGFADLGYVEGRTVRFEHRFADEQYERFRSLAVELVSLDVDVLVAVTRQAAVAAQAATSSIPIVFVVIPDPVGDKFADSLARPGRNMTGLASMQLDINGKRLQLLKEAVPGIQRVALLHNPSDPVASRLNVETVRAAASVLQVDVQPFEARVPEDIDRAFPSIAQARVDAIFVSSDSMLANERQRIAKGALALRLPVTSTSRMGTQAGGLLSYGQDFRVAFRRVAYYADKIFKGEKPGKLPIEQPTRFEMLINLKTARALGVEISPSLLARADEVIE